MDRGRNSSAGSGYYIEGGPVDDPRGTEISLPTGGAGLWGEKPPELGGTNLTLEEAFEQENWIETQDGGLIPFVQEYDASVEENSPQFMDYSDLSDEQKASGKYVNPNDTSIFDRVYSEEEILKAEARAAAGDAYWEALMEGAISFLNGDGMLTDNISTDNLIDLAKNQLASEISNNSGGRNKPVMMKNLRSEKPGFKMAEGTNWWSVDETDPYWQTKRGFEEAMDLYGTKPSWVKESSLEYNPKSGEYDSVKREEFVKLQPTKRISL